MTVEKLDFPDEAFTHSITNLGIFFFADADETAKQTFQTPKGEGTSIVTS